MALKQSVWTELIDEAGILSVLTDEYAQFARPISEALCVFLEGLPADRQTQIVNEQAAMPAASSVAERLGRMAQGCPALHKFGQIVARDRRIAPELRTHLQRLESLPSSIPLGVIRDALGREVGPLDALGVSLKPPALAEASVAVVVPFRRCDDHPADAPCDGVFKILKPGIEVRLEQDLSLLGSVGEYLDERCNELQIPALDYADAFAQVRDKLLQEVRLDHEQKHLRAAYAEYADDHNVQIPRLFEFGSPRVTAMERICGGKVTDAVADSPFDRRRIAETVVASLLARPMFSLLADAPFHCDPHAGNLFVTPDRRLAILDWSLVGSLTVEHRTAVVQIMLAAATLRSDRVISIISNLADRGAADRSALRRIVHASI
ncbi:MAG: AarF/UbiB family protein, partial [Planctomycetota bacterium]